MASRFPFVRTEGALLPSSFLARLAAREKAVEALGPADYHLDPNERLSEAIASAWNRLQPVWAAFSKTLDEAGVEEALTGATREKWLQPLFSALGWGRLAGARPREVGGKSYPVSHEWSDVPIHLVGAGVDLDRRSAGVPGAAKASPHGLVQELLNRDEGALWGIVSNGRKLRLLRDSASLARQAYVEFDLEGIFSAEAFGDFSLLWLLVHPSRFEGERPEKAPLERWARAAAEQGTRALDTLRQGVEKAIAALGQGFLAHPGNAALRQALESGELTVQDYYRELLREVYRLIFLATAEDRGLLHRAEVPEAARERYARFFSLARLRRLATRRLGTRHTDLWRGYRLVVEALSSEAGRPELGLAALGGFLFSPQATPRLDRSAIANRDLLEAIRALSTTRGEGGRLVTVDWRNLGSEELGSVYEALLELHPRVHLAAASFELTSAAGHERKTTGSYYTPSSLIQCLLDSALDPVIAEAAAKPDPAAALLGLKVCDPACGSGHFLIAAAHRIAKRLAAVRSGEEEPSPEATRAALRDVIGHCLYGVDINPMAVELCKVNLWLESQDPRFPLSFLDHRIQCGNSLLGTTPKLLAGGIPDAAFTAIEGDDKEVVKKFRKFNKQERKEREAIQASFEFEPWDRIGHLATDLAALDALPDDSVADVRTKERRYAELVASADYETGRFLADAWCAAFVWRKVDEPGHPEPITERIFRDIEKNPELGTARRVRPEVRRLAAEYRFFHWHLAFPDVFRVPAQGQRPENEAMGWSGGFDCVLGNPPWEQTQVSEKEYFSDREPKIAQAAGASRKALIAALESTNPVLHAAFVGFRSRAARSDALIGNSGLYPLSAVGKLNTYALFAERKRQLLSLMGRVGCILPSGIATDDTTKEFFQDLVDQQQLAALYHFENEDRIFPAVHHAFRFVLFVMAGARSAVAEPPLAAYLRAVDWLRDPECRYTLSREDFRLVNPNTRTFALFRTRRDAEITKAIYRRVPVLVEEAKGETGNPWGVSFRQGLFNMTSDSGLFRTRAELERQGWRLEGNVFTAGEGRYLPLYEAKMVHHFDHRFGSYADQTEEQANQGKLPELTDNEHADPNLLPLPRYWVPEVEVAARLTGRWDRTWFLGFRNVTGATVQRTIIAAVVPRVGVGHSLPLLIPDVGPQLAACLMALLASFCADYVMRQKLGGLNLTFGYFKQLPAPLPSTFGQKAHWISSTLYLRDWVAQRVVELTRTSVDLARFGEECGYEGPPFRWNPERRFEIRCELDAAFFHLYGIAREDVDYILDTFPIVRKNDEKRFGEYRTKRRILELYDRMQRATETGKAFVSDLDPAPGDPRAAHPELPAR